MRCGKVHRSRNFHEGRGAARPRQSTRARLAAIVAAPLFLAGCLFGPPEEDRGKIGFVSGFFGGVAADEPRAVLIGRDILSSGGSAADAAVAMYFALAVTMPSSAALGGGGVCLVHDKEKETTEALEFFAGAPSAATFGSDRPSAVPGNPRGFYALHAKYGRLKWSRLLAPSENLARFGVQVSRAFAHELAQVGDALLAEPEAARILGRPDGGGLVGEGDFLVQLDLAATISALRSRGPGEFYNGATTAKLVKAVVDAGGTLSRHDLMSYRPRWRDTVKVEFGNNTLHFAPPPAAAGVVAAEMWTMLALEDRFEDAKPDERGHLIAETALRAYADRGSWLAPDVEKRVDVGGLAAPRRMKGLMATYDPGVHTPASSIRPPPRSQPENPAATSFVVADNEGGAVACALTMNNLFGTGRFAPGSGVLLAAAPEWSVGRGPLSLGPMMATNQHVFDVYFAAAASGGVGAPVAMTQVAARHLLGGKSLARALAQPRAHHGGYPDLTFHESGMPRDQVEALVRRKHVPRPIARLGLVNALSCPGGLVSKSETCAVANDPRGYGLSASADEAD